MLDTEEIAERLLQADEILHRDSPYSSVVTLTCVLRLLLFKRLTDQANTENGQSLSIDGIYWSAIEQAQGKFAEKFDLLFRLIETNNSTLEEVFVDSEDNFWGKFDDEALREVIHIFSKLNLSDQNLSATNSLGEACESFLKQKVGEVKTSIYTPEGLSRLLAELIDSEQVTSIYDPVCGFGETLTAFARLKKTYGENSSQVAFCGQSRRYGEATIARINLMLHGVDRIDIRQDDVFFNPQFVQNEKLISFDAVVVNPPFNITLSPNHLREIERRDQLPYGIPQSADNGTYLIIQHILFSLKNGGKAAVVLPLGILAGKKGDREIRRKIIESGQIEAVILLAPKLFYGSSIPAAVMVLKKNAERRDVVLVDASQEYVAGRRQNRLSLHNIDCIVHAYQVEIEEGFSKLVSIEEIAANNYSLSVGRYLTKPHDEKFNLNTEVEKLRGLEIKHSQLRKKIGDHLEALGIET